MTGNIDTKLREEAPQFVTLNDTHESDAGDLEAAAEPETVVLEQSEDCLGNTGGPLRDRA